MKSTRIWTLTGAVLTGILWLMGASLLPGIIPSPQSTLVRLWTMFQTEDLGYQAMATFLRSVLSGAAGLALGLVLGTLLGSRPRADALGSVPLHLLQGLPPLVWSVPLVLIFYELRALVPALVVVMVVLPLGLVSSREARRTLSPDKEAVFKIYAPGHRLLRIRELIIPHLTPAIRSSLILGLVLGLKSALVGEWLAGQDGLGSLMHQYYQVLDLNSFGAVTLVFLVQVLVLALGTVKLADIFLPLEWLTPRTETLGNPGSQELPCPSSPKGAVFQNVSFSYGKRRVISHFNLEIPPGSTLVLSGNSGVGKTTLARLALGLLKPQSGLVDVPGKPGCLFQEDGLLAHRDALGNVALPLWAEGKKDWENLSRMWLEQVGLGDRLGDYPSQLSGGQRKRLALARALAHNPGFMVLDEPFNNLDRPSRRELWDLYWRIFPQRGLTSLIITHYPEELSKREALFYTLGKEGTLEKYNV